jgi:long-chain acyl-CoA synthetase
VVARPDLSELDTFPKLLLHNAANWPGDVAMREKDLGIWHTVSWSAYRDHVRLVALGLRSLGLRRGEVVAIIGRNRPNWVFGELAAQSLGCMTLGIYEDALAAEADYLLRFAGAAIVLCEDEEQVDKLLSLGDAGLRWLIHHDPRGMRKYDDPRLLGWEQLLARGAELLRREPALFETEVALGRGDDVAVLCTTSGTTAQPKLAMLQFRPFLLHIAAYLRADPREASDEYVSILPLPWIMEQVYVVVMPLLCRIRVSFPEGAETAMRDLREIGPTHVMLAPRVWEQTAAEIRARIMDADRLTRALFAWAVRAGSAALQRRARHRLADLLVFAPLRDRLGFSRLKSAATGGAGLGPETFKFLLAMGVPLRQLYGQTEAAGAYTLQLDPELDFDSSGVPFDDTELRIADPDRHGVGEILTRNAGLFKGYFGDDAATRAVLGEDGWFRTGDAGFLDDEGRLTVIDRVGDLARTTHGATFSPQHIENRLKFSPFIGECVVLGHGRPFLAAIVCIRYAMVAKWAEGSRLAFTGYQTLAAHPQVGQLLAAEVEKVNAMLPEQQRIGRFLLLYKELDPDDGELTRTRKVRRRVIDERYGPLIEAIYAGRTEVLVASDITFEDGRIGRTKAELVIHDAVDQAKRRRAA